MEKIKNEQQNAELKEKQEGPYVEIWITRHANRLSTGDLTPEGIEAAEKKGLSLSFAEVHKGYAPSEKDDKTLRAYKTVDIVSEASEIKSAKTGKKYETRKREGLSYNLAGPLMPKIKEYTKSINEAVKKNHPDFDPKSKDPKWGKIREGYQYIALQNLLARDKPLVHIFAMGVAHQFYNLVKLSETYVQKRDYLEKKGKADPIKKDIILDEGTHGVFIESLLQKALIRIQKDAQEKRAYDTWVDETGQGQLEERMGGILKPTESIKTKYKLGEDIPDRLPLSFEGKHFTEEECFLDMSRIKKLHDQFEEYFKAFQKWESDKTEQNEKELIKLVDQLVKEFGN